MRYAAGVLWFTAGFVGSCASAAEPPATQDVRPAEEAEDTETIWDGVFTADQARRGERVAQSECSLCHDVEIEWTYVLERWSGQSIGDLYDLVRLTMPQNYPGGLSLAEYADVVAYMLELNGVPRGEAELPTDDERLRRIVVTLAPGS